MTDKSMALRGPVLEGVQTGRGEFGVLPSGALPRIPEFAGAGPQLPGAALPAPPQGGPVFVAAPDPSTDLLDHAAQLRPLAELAAHRATQTPLTMALLAGPGGGKSAALGRLCGQVAALARTSGTGPLLSAIACVTLDAAALEGEPGLALADSLYAGLCAQEPFASFARDAAEVAGDPHQAAREHGEKLDKTRRELEAQRNALADTQARRNRLAEVVLSETPGSPVDAYARSNRGMIERRLRAFGFASGDAVANYKDLVRDLSESGGGGILGFLHATWAFAGQTRRLVWALVFVALYFGLGSVEASKNVWLDSLTQAGPNIAPIAAWLAAHAAWLGIMRTAALAIAALLVAWTLLRALRFMLPLSKGVRLLRADVAARRGELDGEVARQERRLEELVQAAGRHERGLRIAEQRVAAAGGGGRVAPASLRADAADHVGRGFVAALGRLMAKGEEGRGAPQRLVLALDNLDALAPDRCGAVLAALSREFGRPGFVCVLAADPARLGLAPLERFADIPLRLAAPRATQASMIVLDLLGHQPAARRETEAAPSALERPLGVAEAKLLSDLAPLAGRSPRHLRRFVNLHKLARAAHPGAGPALALMLALDIGGEAEDVAAMRKAVARAMPDGEIFGSDMPAGLAPFADIARMANGGRLRAGEASAAMAMAATHSLREPAN